MSLSVYSTQHAHTSNVAWHGREWSSKFMVCPGEMCVPCSLCSFSAIHPPSTITQHRKIIG